MKEDNYLLRGFTIIEILIVIAIIGILASVVLTSLDSARAKAETISVISEIDGLKKSMEILYQDTLFYPNATQSFCRTVLPVNNEIDLNATSSGLTANGQGWLNWNGPYIQNAIDIWDTPYYLDEDYDCTTATEGCKGETVSDVSVIVSCGPDKDTSGTGGSCAYNDDNIVVRLCD
ncbi:MAG: prepilin-type N-terminal cleavage/methylation domain-containing protein [Minisyncoccia bacterium]